jgi:hypothetical protein
MLTGSMPSAVFISDGVPVTLVRPAGRRAAQRAERTHRALSRLRRLAHDVDERRMTRGAHVLSSAPDGLRHV